MADELVQINNNKENVFEFDLSIQGVNESDIDAKFVIRSAEMDLAFTCEKQENGKWAVKLPALPMLERTTYPFHFQVVAEGFHFQPLKGSVNVVGSNEVYISTPKSKLTAPTKRTQVAERVTTLGKDMHTSKPLPTRNREKGIAQIANELMENHGMSKKVAESKAPRLAQIIEENVDEPEVVLPILSTADVAKDKKNKAAIAVLEEMGIRPQPPRTKQRFSILKDLNDSK